MIKGWKLSPAWREYYDSRDKERTAQRMERLMAEFQIRQAQINAECAIAALARAPISVKVQP